MKDKERATVQIVQLICAYYFNSPGNKTQLLKFNSSKP